jgi:hypothetical protein
MKCEQAQNQIADFLDGLLDVESADALQEHLQACPACAGALAEEQDFRNKFKGLLGNERIPPPSYGFVDRALQNAVDRSAKLQHHRSGFIKGFATAVAATLALWVIVTVQQPVEDPSADASSQELHIALHQTKDIKLAFHAKKDLADATIRISLSDNVNLVGYQGRQTLEWHTNLVRGDNVLSLPVKAIKANKGRVIAEVRHKDLVKSIVIELNVKGPGVSESPNHQYIPA